MSIENELRALTDAVEALNSNLKVIIGALPGVGLVPTPAAEIAPADPAPEPTKAKGKKAKPAPAEEPPAAATKADVIAALKDLQSVAGPAGVKALLDEHGARNVGGLPEADYGRVIEQAAALVSTMEKAA